MSLPGSAAFAAALTAATLLAIGAGLFLIGSPAHIRELRLDEQRVADLTALAPAITAYDRQYHRLPASLDELHKSNHWPNYRSFGAGPYDYRTTDTTAYELCADFAAPSDDVAVPLWQRKQWSHAAGHVCFKREAR
jgi:hypothetical protein